MKNVMTGEWFVGGVQQYQIKLYVVRFNYKIPSLNSNDRSISSKLMASKKRIMSGRYYSGWTHYTF